MEKPFQHTFNALRFAVCLCCLAQCILGSSSSCFTSVAVIGKNATVTCKFAEDVGALKRDFSVYKYPLGTVNFQDAKKTRVADCVWGANPSPDCIDGNGFSLRNSYSSIIIVDVPEVTVDTEGLYVCQLVLGSQTPDTSPASCNLTVTNASSIAADMVNTLSNNGNSEGLDGLHIGLIVAVVVLVLALVGSWIAFVCGRKILERCSSLKQTCCAKPQNNAAPIETESAVKSESAVQVELAVKADEGVLAEEPKEKTSRRCPWFFTLRNTQNQKDVKSQPAETAILLTETAKADAPTKELP